MADDRMAIVCKNCNLGIAIAKFWHPSSAEFDLHGGWIMLGLSEERGKAFLALHAHCEDEDGYIRPCHYYLGYETDGKGWVYDTRLDNHKG